MQRDLNEMNRLEDYLKEHGIKYERIDEEEDGPHMFEIHQIVVFDEEGKRAWDVVCHRGSYGAAAGRLEGMGVIFGRDVGRDVKGWLTAEAVIERIEAHD